MLWGFRETAAEWKQGELSQGRKEWRGRGFQDWAGFMAGLVLASSPEASFLFEPELYRRGGEFGASPEDVRNQKAIVG